MKKTFFCSLLALTAILLFSNIPSAEARGHCHHRHCGVGTRVQLNLGNYYNYSDAYVVRRYAPVYAQPVIVQPAPCYAPIYAYPAPVVEEVYVARPRPLTLGGLSFSWNFFK